MEYDDDDSVTFRSVVALMKKKDFPGAMELIREIEKMRLSDNERQIAEKYKRHCAGEIASRLSTAARKAYQRGEFRDSNTSIEEYVSYGLENAPWLGVTKESLLYLLRAREDFHGVQTFSVHEIERTLLEKTEKMSRVPETQKFLKTFAKTIALKVVNDSML